MNEMLKKLAIVGSLAVVAVFGVACSDDDSGSSEAIAPVNAVISAEDPDDPSALTCADGLSAVDLPLGSRQDIDGTSFELVEKMADHPEYPNSQPQIQKSVTLNVKLASSIGLPAVVIHTSNGSAPTTEPEDGQLSLGLPADGTGSYEIISDAYVYDQYVYAGQITGLTLCLDYSNSRP